jgi:hypothetical protein
MPGVLEIVVMHDAAMRQMGCLSVTVTMIGVGFDTEMLEYLYSW